MWRQNPFPRRRDEWQLLRQLQAWRHTGRLPIVLHDRPYGETRVCAHRDSFGRRFCHLSLEISAPPQRLFLLVLHMTGRFTDRLRAVLQIRMIPPNVCTCAICAASCWTPTVND
jgi:hypothetical protein